MTRRFDLGACNARTDGPSQWIATTSPYGPGDWLVGESDDYALAVVAPGAPAASVESARQRLRWRVVSWPLAGESEPRAAVEQVAVAEVVALLGPEHATWIRDVCKGQLRHLERFASTLAGTPHEDRARAAAGPSARLRDELAEAFPGEAWHRRTEITAEEIPDTAGGFLRSVDGPPAAKADRVFEQLAALYYRAVDAYRGARRRRRAWRRAIAGHASATGAGPDRSGFRPDCDDRSHLAG